MRAGDASTFAAAAIPYVLVWTDPTRKISVRFASHVIRDIENCERSPYVLRGSVTTDGQKTTWRVSFFEVLDSSSLDVKDGGPKHNARSSIIGLAAGRPKHQSFLQEFIGYKGVFAPSILGVTVDRGVASIALHELATGKSTPLVDFSSNFAVLQASGYAPFESSDSTSTPVQQQVISQLENEFALPRSTPADTAAPLPGVAPPVSSRSYPAADNREAPITERPHEVAGSHNQRSRTSRFGLTFWIFAAACILMGGLAVRAYWPVSVAVRQPEPLPQTTPAPPASDYAEEIDLSLTSKGVNVELSWDPRKVIFRGVTSASVKIVDGDERAIMVLSTTEVATGHVLYTPRTRKVSFELDVETKSGHLTGRTMFIKAK